MKNIKNIKFLAAFFFLSSVFFGANAQIYLGLKAGVNVSKANFNNENYKKFYDTKLKPGLTAGAIFLMETKKQFGLYTEINYSVKGKSIVSHANDYETNNARYHSIDIPVMFRLKFQQPKFSWFLQCGPEVSYWLSGSGVLGVYDPNRDIITDYAYKINFGKPETSSDYMNVDEANHIQLGFALGGGLVWDLNNANYISFDMRLSLVQSFMGGYESGSIPNIGHVDNFEHNNNVLAVSAVYYFDIMEKNRLSKNKYRKQKK